MLVVSVCLGRIDLQIQPCEVKDKVMQLQGHAHQEIIESRRGTGAGILVLSSPLKPRSATKALIQVEAFEFQLHFAGTHIEK